MNLLNALGYHQEHLSVGDYYSGSHSAGMWYGKGAKALGLEGVVKEMDFKSLCKGRNPSDGSRLTQRLNTVRSGKISNRRIFYELVYAPWKSVSVAALVLGDERVKAAHNAAVKDSLKEAESFASYRVRRATDTANGKDRGTDNLTVALFRHDTSRAVTEGQVPDCHLHTHAVVFNCTQAADGKWMALQNFEILKAQKYLNAIYEHSLCRRLHAIGYETRPKANGSLELAHISDETCDKFSKRHFAIQKRTANLLASGVKIGEKKLASMVAHDKRIRKQPNLATASLREAWLAQIPENEKVPVDLLCLQKRPRPDAKTSLSWAKGRIFERNATCRPADLLAAALEHGRGADFELEGLKAVYLADPEIIHEKGGSRRITTQKTLDTEKYLLSTTTNGKGKYHSLASGLLPSAETLTALQRQAADKLLASLDMVSVFKGGAGTGKSFTLHHVAAAIEAEGTSVHVLAPQNQQVLDLRKDGFTRARTLASFLADTTALEPNSVILLDEAGQVGGADMAQLFQRASDADARIICAGDTRQLGSVSASSALLAIERYADPYLAILGGEEAIQRQKVAWYKRAVADAEKGNAVDALSRLQKNGCIHETLPGDRQGEAARVFAALKKEGSCLAISQTNEEAKLLNTAIRTELLATGHLDASTLVEVDVLRPLDLTLAEKQQSGSYENRVVTLNRPRAGLPSGQKVQFVEVTKTGGVVLQHGTTRMLVSDKNLSSITICEPETITLAKGDLIRLKANCLTGSNRLANGQILTFQGMTAEGGLLVKDSSNAEHALPRHFRTLQYGYATTSYGSQGRTTDHVVILDSACKAATNQNEFYVAISRGRLSCNIITGDVAALAEHVSRLGNRDLASDLTLDAQRTDLAEMEAEMEM
ncbi:hypothetical protein BH09VER1_BH09VER1_26470 [soil metagenome]